MKKFIAQIFLFLILLSASAFWVFSNVDGTSDQYYLRLATPKQSALIIGVSKSAQGLQPKVFNEVLNRNDMFNFSFNAFISPFGATYLESIKNKLKEDTKDGLFVITFDAWSLGSNTEDPNDSKNFREVDLCLSSSFVSSNPNIPYLVNHYDKKYIDIFKKSKKTLLLHEDGWMEVNVAMDSIARERRLNNSIKHYHKLYVPDWKTSSLRFKYLEKTIDFLKNHGEVYLVRLPVHERLLELENNVTPDLDSRIQVICENFNVPYLNYADSSSNYKYTDGIHLGKNSGARISKQVAEWIKESKNEK